MGALSDLLGVLSFAAISICVLLVLLNRGLETQYASALREQYPDFMREATYSPMLDSVARMQQDQTLNSFYEVITLEDASVMLSSSVPVETVAEEQALIDSGKHTSRQLRVLVVCGQHPRELISSELCVRLIHLLQTTERHRDLTSRIFKLQQRHVEFYVVPFANARMRAKLDAFPSKHGCVRTNVNGVDLNRNFVCPDFVREPQQKPGDAAYPGEEDMSELETRQMAQLIKEIRPHLLLNVHSGARLILLPYDSSALEMPADYSTMVRVAKLSRSAVPLLRDVPLGKASMLLYESHGTLVDYALTSRDVPLAYTLEIYQGERSEQNTYEEQLTPDKCFELFNPPHGDAYRSVIQSWITFVVELCERTSDRLHQI